MKGSTLVAAGGLENHQSIHGETESGFSSFRSKCQCTRYSTLPCLAGHPSHRCFC